MSGLFEHSHEEGDDDESRQKWGEEAQQTERSVRVSDPETRSSGLNKFTTYVVSGKTATGSDFSSRKRYSDFEWIQKALNNCFPGTFVPPLPKKQTMGRFEDAFIERRRQRLEEFLHRVFNRPYLASSQVFCAWLTRNESGMEELKRTFDKRPFTNCLSEFRQSLQPYIRSELLGSAKERLQQFRCFLGTHQAVLQKLYKALARLSANNVAATAVIGEIHEKMNELHEGETKFLTEAYELKQAPRANLGEPFFRLHQGLKDSPCSHVDLLVSVAARELDDIGCMQEAVRQYDRLIANVCNLKAQAESQGKELDSVRSSERGNMFAALVQRKGKEEQIDSIEKNIGKLKEDALTGDEWAALARAVLVTKEMPEFVIEKVRTYQDVMLEFSHRQQALHLQAGDVWRQFLRDFHEASQNTNAPIPPPLPPGVVGTERFRPSTDALGGTMDDFLTAQQRASMSAAAAASGGGVPGAPGYPLGSEEEPEDLSSIWTEEAGQGRGFSSSGGDRGGGGGSAGGGSRRGSRSGSRGGGGGNPLNRGPSQEGGGGHEMAFPLH
uniref:PX domain-containing protein n=1 Tax=Chromera velia CCMP2878 TaxID=1169474 RepID=A0A0G4HW32_9ALVE|eukprot:Cvel_32500.t1-p1 / transcript=Cvel_32500.t1 / gene=Cvel_32500 / organism=Chromera_velia_CCMP2878 / gene_product=Sorting nexin-7, putative / transcript_product=Sorting nexin-7, putative / location=Cvel_scaffold5069:3300-5965(+) / protein_length=553 / sequence_SO=supercontig / SO=protein_coding / is_pseudo=false